MRVKEWYGWHFPELAKVVPDNLQYCRTIQRLGNRKNAPETSFSDILPEEIEREVKEVVQISMGTEVRPVDHLQVSVKKKSHVGGCFILLDQRRGHLTH